MGGNANATADVKRIIDGVTYGYKPYVVGYSIVLMLVIGLLLIVTIVLLVMQCRTRRRWNKRRCDGMKIALDNTDHHQYRLIHSQQTNRLAEYSDDDVDDDNGDYNDSENPYPLSPRRSRVSNTHSDTTYLR